MKNKTLLSIFIIILLVPAFGLAQTVIQITEGEDKIDGALFTASAGDIIELTTDGGVYNEAFTAIIDMPITIRAAAGLTTKPTWTCDDTDRTITLGSVLTLDGIILDGSLGDSLTTDGIRTGSEAGIILKVNNCVFRNFNSGVAGDEDGHAIKGKQEARVDTLIVTNSRFEHMPGEHISYKDGVPDSTDGPVKYARIEYCTFWDGENEAIYIEDNDGDSATEPHPVIIVNHVTVVGFGEKPIYPKETDGAVIKNSIVANTDIYACRIYQSGIVENFLYYNAPDGIQTSDNASYDSDLVLEDQNPYFEDVDNGGFAVAANSPAAKFADDGAALGDSNNGTWDASAITRWEIVENNDWGTRIKNAVTDGDTVMFVSDGGAYHTPGSISTKEITLTFMAKPGLEAKPVLTVDYYTSSLLKIHGPSTVKGLRFQGNGMLNNPDSTGGDVTPYLLYWEDEGQHYGTTTIEDCDFITARLRSIHTDDKNTTDTLIVNNCYFEEIGETAIYGKEAVRNINVAKITNNTFYKIGSTPMRLTNVGELEFSHNTVAVLDSSLTGRGTRGIFAENDTVVVIKDNIFSYVEGVGARVYGPSPTVEYNLFWECGEKIDSEDTTLTFPTFNDEGDPMFADTSLAGLNLAIDEAGDAFQFASDGTNLGDNRWGSHTLSGINNKTNSPLSYALHQNYPNPFNPSTTITFNIAEPGVVKLTVFNVLGQEVITLVDNKMQTGSHTIVWNAGNMATGVYFYKLNVNSFEKIKKMLLIK